MEDFIKNLPKIELHLHIEGTLEPELMFALSKRNQVALPYASVEDIRQAYNFTNLQDFLDIYYQGMSVLQTEQDFYDLTKSYLTRMHEQHVVHVEIFFDPQGHTERGVAFATVINGISAALRDAELEFGITSKLILCFLRHLPEDAAMATLTEALPYRDKISGVGLDSSEIGNPPAKFARVFAKAREEGLRIVAHAGEEGPPEYVLEALDILKVNRIDHGNRALEDESLIKKLIREKIALTVCPLSNLKLCVVKSLQQHPLKRMLDLGIMATINSDDPAYFGGYMHENFLAITNALALERQDIIQLARNAITASFADENRKSQLTQQLDEYIAEVA